MRVLLKILLFPVTLALSMIMGVCDLRHDADSAGTRHSDRCHRHGGYRGEPLIIGLKIAGLAWLVAPLECR